MQTSASLLGQMDWLTLVLVAIAAFATALCHSVAGFAGALLLSVCLAPLIGVKEVVPVVALAMIISNTNRTLLFRRQINWRAYTAIMMTALPGIVFGAMVYLYLSVSATVASTFDGFPLAKNGRAGPALVMQAAASFIGGTVGVILITILAPMFSQVSRSFGPPEYFLLAVMGMLTLIVMIGQN